MQVEMYAQCLLRQRGYHSYVGYQWLPEEIKTWKQLRAWLDSTSPTAAFWGKRMLIAAGETGYPGWYEWNVDNWGTKWGAYQYAERERAPGSFTFEFQTAWAVPIPIFEKLASMYPTLVFGLISIDEGGPEYEGTFQHGLCQFERKPENNERYKIVYGKYPPTDDEEED
jgi:hypothetical protein